MPSTMRTRKADTCPQPPVTWFWWSLLAPDFNNSSTMCKCPLSAALISAVSPDWVQVGDFEMKYTRREPMNRHSNLTDKPFLIMYQSRGLRPPDQSHCANGLYLTLDHAPVHDTHTLSILHHTPASYYTLHPWNQRTKESTNWTRLATLITHPTPPSTQTMASKRNLPQFSRGLDELHRWVNLVLSMRSYMCVYVYPRTIHTWCADKVCVFMCGGVDRVCAVGLLMNPWSWVQYGVCAIV